MKIKFDIYKIVQITVMVLTIVVTGSMILSKNYKDLAFLKYINSVSAIASILMVLITIINKIKLDKSIIVNDMERYIKTIYLIIGVFLVVSIVTLFILIINNLSIQDKLNDILGVLSLCIALCTEIMAEYITERIVKKSRRKFENRYNTLYD